MAWNDFLQQGKGLYQQGQNWLTGNNLTSQDPNTIRAMNAQPFDPNARISDTSFSDRRYEDSGTHHLPLAMPTQTRNLNYNIHQDPPRDWREDYQGTYGAPTPDLYSNEPAMMNLKRDGIMATDQAQDKGNFLKRIMDSTLMGKVMGSFKRPEQMNEAYESITDSIDPNTGRGTYKGNEYRIEGNKIYSELFPEGKNFDSMFGSKSIEEMENEGYGSIGWAQERLQKGKNISQRLRNILKSRGIGEGGNFINRPTNEGAQFKPDVPAAAGTPVTTGGGGTFNPRMDPKGRGQTRDSWHGATAARQAAGKQVAGPGGGRGAYWADGGRVGYQGGELVEQETDFIEGPQGGEEFQETVVEGQEQPSREQLEALAMEIFQLPLEELDEQQLVVVYQEAMQGQPMEEAVQEEDVQFAANGGLASLL